MKKLLTILSGLVLVGCTNIPTTPIPNVETKAVVSADTKQEVVYSINETMHGIVQFENNRSKRATFEITQPYHKQIETFDSLTASQKQMVQSQVQQQLNTTYSDLDIVQGVTIKTKALATRAILFIQFDLDKIDKTTYEAVKASGLDNPIVGLYAHALQLRGQTADDIKQDVKNNSETSQIVDGYQHLFNQDTGEPVVTQ